MSTLNPTRKVSRRHELREDTVVTFYARALGYFENNRNIVLGALGVIIFVVLAFVTFAWNQTNKNEKALSEMAIAVQKYEAGEYQAALDGDASFVGLVDIASEYGSTDSGNLARFYAADALFRVGNMDEALKFFESYSKDSNYLGASAFAGEAAIHELNGDFKKAGDLFVRAATVFESEITSPMYLESAARAYEAAGETSKALSAYETIRDDYPNSQAARNVDFFLAKLEAGS
jgi:tetratricopeptide (TPR) repeat protein